MRIEDAIKTLKELWRETNDPWYEEVYNMAINALEADRKTEPQTDELGEAKVLLKASRDLLNKQNETIYVLNLLDETVEYHDVECDGYCLIDDIDDWLALQTEPQTCSVNGRPYDCGNCEYFRCTADEPQTGRPCDNCQEFDCYGCEYKQTERKE